MIQARKVLGAVVIYAGLSAGFVVFWLSGTPRWPTTSVGWALLFIGALPVSFAIEFAGSRMLSVVDYAPGARRPTVWLSRILLAATLVAVAVLCMWIATMVGSG